MSSILDALRRGRAGETASGYGPDAADSVAVLRTLGCRAETPAPRMRPRKSGIRYVILYAAFAMLTWAVLASF